MMNKINIILLNNNKTIYLNLRKIQLSLNITVMNNYQRIFQRSKYKSDVKNQKMKIKKSNVKILQYTNLFRI